MIYNYFSPWSFFGYSPLGLVLNYSLDLLVFFIVINSRIRKNRILNIESRWGSFIDYVNAKYYRIIFFTIFHVLFGYFADFLAFIFLPVFMNKVGWDQVISGLLHFVSITLLQAIVLSISLHNIEIPLTQTEKNVFLRKIRRFLKEGMIFGILTNPFIHMLVDFVIF